MTWPWGLAHDSYTPFYDLHRQVFNQAVFQAKSARELMDAVSNFMDCSIVIPPTEIQNEEMLTSIISFQKKLLKDRVQSSNPAPLLESKPHTGTSSVWHLKISATCYLQQFSDLSLSSVSFFCQCQTLLHLHQRTRWPGLADRLAGWFETWRDATSTTRVTSQTLLIPRSSLPSSSSTLPPCHPPSPSEDCLVCMHVSFQRGTVLVRDRYDSRFFLNHLCCCSR